MVSISEIEVVVQMLDLLYEKDHFLLMRSLNVSECAITFRMGLHLQSILQDKYDVDCEYNGMGKQCFDFVYYTAGDYFAKTVGLSGNDVSDEDDKGSRVFPDIIVHKRGTAENYMVIEVKVEWKNYDSTHDFKKLNAYMKDLKYKFACFIELSEERDNVRIEYI